MRKTIVPLSLSLPSFTMIFATGRLNEGTLFETSLGRDLRTSWPKSAAGVSRHGYELN